MMLSKSNLLLQGFIFEFYVIDLSGSSPFSFRVIGKGAWVPMESWMVYYIHIPMPIKRKQETGTNLPTYPTTPNHLSTAFPSFTSRVPRHCARMGICHSRWRCSCNSCIGQAAGNVNESLDGHRFNVHCGRDV